jgi:hypothetical protein
MVAPCPLPPQALLARYARDGSYVDCYVTEIARTVSHAQYVEAFYTTAVFRLERLILKWAVSRPSSDEEARRLAAGEIGAFAAWRVENRAEDQLLLCDLLGGTRSWLMVAPAGPARTRLYFGSAVVRLSGGYRALLAFHKLYSRVLLGAARSRLRSSVR